MVAIVILLMDVRCELDGIIVGVVSKIPWKTIVQDSQASRKYLASISQVS